MHAGICPTVDPPAMQGALLHDLVHLVDAGLRKPRGAKHRHQSHGGLVLALQELRQPGRVSELVYYRILLHLQLRPEPLQLVGAVRLSKHLASSVSSPGPLDSKQWMHLVARACMCNIV